ncbi:DUF5302 domain-containing protein [Mycobacterium tilburgii]|uniref:DUF5302 domain-containing protein n=1 Tax=Mycobacterium tilburgii TaxID=44467 RepID=UPI001182E31D|nr:DUF5302 domain-containing protein [Mycobacterium tilburgii]
MAELNSKQDAAGAEDENKRKFSEALDRKMSKASRGSDHKDGGGKQSRAHGAAAGGRREFRRKSG